MTVYCGQRTPSGRPCARYPHRAGVHLTEGAIRFAREAYERARATLAVPAQRRPAAPVKAAAS